MKKIPDIVDRHAFEIAMSKRVKSAREARGLSREELSRISGVGQRTIYRSEAAETGLQAWSVTRLARALGLAPSSLMPTYAEIEEARRAFTGEESNAA